VIFSTVLNNQRPDIPADNALPGDPGPSLGAYKKLMESCWSPNPVDRPPFDAIVAEFEAMRNTERVAHKVNISYYFPILGPLNRHVIAPPASGLTSL
jgi:hypothetical protein